MGSMTIIYSQKSMEIIL